jgi:hypothetical protein
MWCAIWIKALKFVLLVAFNQRNNKKKRGYCAVAQITSMA